MLLWITVNHSQHLLFTKTARV